MGMGILIYFSKLIFGFLKVDLKIIWKLFFFNFFFFNFVIMLNTKN